MSYLKYYMYYIVPHQNRDGGDPCWFWDSPSLLSGESSAILIHKMSVHNVLVIFACVSVYMFLQTLLTNTFFLTIYGFPGA